MDGGFLIEAGGDVDVIVGGPAGDIDDDGDVHGLEEGDFFFEEGVEADVGQADGVEHAGAGFDDAVGFVAFAWGFGDGLGDEGAEFGEVGVVGVFVGVAAGAGGGHEGVLEFHFADGDGEGGGGGGDGGGGGGHGGSFAWEGENSKAKRETRNACRGGGWGLGGMIRCGVANSAGRLQMTSVMRLGLMAVVGAMIGVSAVRGADWAKVQEIKKDLLGQAATHAMEQQKKTAGEAVAVPFPAGVTAAGGVKVVEKSAKALRVTGEVAPYMWQGGQADLVRIELPAAMDMVSGHSGLAMVVQVVPNDPAKEVSTFGPGADRCAADRGGWEEGGDHADGFAHERVG